MTINENLNLTDYVSGIQLRDCSKLAINWKIGNDVTIFSHDIIINFFDARLFIFITDWPEIGNTPIQALPNIWRLGQVRNAKFGTLSLLKCYWMLQIAKVTVFTVSELLREDQLREVKLPEIRVKSHTERHSFCCFVALDACVITPHIIWYFA